ncbi:hypothetical protein SCHPADRAFT_421973 [Schizopora paradoxa]|uniref:Uncharacterized protein n=1 Tax=Schizopora paradoxa TaxID=27342 RepID=A0A0H2S663_9AGAM|nr:hypothetical protein SCHPADRAFT_421973 [Schizopora paradoxa]
MTSERSREKASYFVVLIMIQMDCSSGRKVEEAVAVRSGGRGDCRYDITGLGVYRVRKSCVLSFSMSPVGDVNHAAPSPDACRRTDKISLDIRALREYVKETHERLQEPYANVRHTDGRSEKSDHGPATRGVDRVRISNVLSGKRSYLQRI